MVKVVVVFLVLAVRELEVVDLRAAECARTLESQLAFFMLLLL